MVINGQEDDGTLRCQVMDNLIVNKLLLNKARQDSIEVSEAEVSIEVTRRVTFMIEQMGGAERNWLKSMASLSNSFRPISGMMFGTDYFH
ncbi:MAG: hypothetical protein R3B93_20160 [Bacteroidia bacterium]